MDHTIKAVFIVVVVCILIFAFVVGLPYYTQCAAHHGFIEKGLCYTPTGIYWPWS